MKGTIRTHLILLGANALLLAGGCKFDPKSLDAAVGIGDSGEIAASEDGPGDLSMVEVASGDQIVVATDSSPSDTVATSADVPPPSSDVPTPGVDVVAFDMSSPEAGAKNLGTGARCGTSMACTSGFCVDGVCCASACDKKCQACAQSKTGQSDGVCAPVTAGTNPDQDCAVDPTNPCGTDGTCDGAGSCRLRGTNIKCADAICSGSTFTPERQCDGAGKCQDPHPANCGLYNCSATGCKQTCAGGGDCTSPTTCVDGMCGGKRANGATCSSSTECSSNNCVDGVCCGTACGGTCEACVMAKTGQPDGTCAAITNGTDPDNECPNEGPSSCGYDGSCNGARACRRYVAGTSCMTANCSGSTFTPMRQCDGQGTCASVNAQGCGSYTCTSTGCRTSCTQDADCTGGNICIGTSCGQKKAQGAGCGAAAECTTGACVDGVCCENTCGGTCMACSQSKTGSADGLCRAVANGTDPDSECPAQAASTCGTDGSCNGAGACRMYSASTACGTASCNGNSYVPGGTCSGSGSCTPGTGTPCGAYACTTSGCRTSCSGGGYDQDPNCAPGYGCKDYTTQCAALGGTWSDTGYINESGRPTGTSPPAMGSGCVPGNSVKIQVVGPLAGGTQCQVVRNASDDAEWCPGKFAFRQTDLEAIRECGTTLPTWGPTFYGIDHPPVLTHTIWCLPTTTSPQWVDCLSSTLGCNVNNKYVSKLYHCF